jgi:hypothetical protein
MKAIVGHGILYVYASGVNFSSNILFSDTRKLILCRNVPLDGLFKIC